MADTTQPGYFRIGMVELQIPPTDISTNKVVNDDQISTLRGGTPMFVKSGQARWDVTVVWKAIRVVREDGTYDNTQWEDLRTVVAMFKASPFVEVENDFLRQHFTNISQSYQSQRMGFALRQIRIDTNPDSINVLDVTLTMSLFNFAPYSTDFSYVGADGGSVDAIDSDQFTFYISHWMNVNMDNNPHSLGEPELQPWDQQEDGTLSFKWRKYLYVPFNSAPPQSISRASAGYTQTVPPPKVPKAQSTPNGKKLSNDIQAIINAAAAEFGLDPAIVTAQCLYESGGKPNAVSSTGAIGLMQLVPSTARALGVTDPYDPVQNVRGGCRYLAEQLKKFKNYAHALGAYNAGPGYIYAYRDGKSIKTKGGGVINPQALKTPDGLPPAGIPHNENVPKYVQTILTNAGKQGDITITPPIGITTPPPVVTSTTVIDVPDQNIMSLVNAAIKMLPAPDPGNNWLLDHYTEYGAYFYQDEEIYLASADASSAGDYDMYPNQLSVVMINNLPVIPLAGMQYPTYQHVGPADTIISISMNSVGTDDGTLSEPSHEGIQALTAMSSQLEDQFHQLRNNFRAVSSIHRMQAVFIENQILNMLGIRGTLIRGLNTETVPESENLVQVSVMGSQYENIFEDTSPFRINGTASAYSSTLQSILKSNDLQNASPEEQNAYTLVKQFSDKWKAHDEAFLLQEILSITSSGIDFLSNTDTPATNIWYQDRDTLFNALDLRGNPTLKSLSGSTGLGSTLNLSNTVNTAIGLGKAVGAQLLSGSIAPSAKAIDLGTQAIQQSQPYQRDKWPGLQKRRALLQGSQTPMSYADYMVFSQLPVLVDSTAVSKIRSTIEAQFAKQKSDIIESLYQRLFDYELLTNPAFSRQATAITNSPAFKSKFNSQITVKGPALDDPSNVGHFCYKDLGLTDYRQNPADYFVNHNDTLNELTRGKVQAVMTQTDSAASAVNNTLLADAQKAKQAGNFAAYKQLTASGTTGFVFSGDTTQLLPGSSDAMMRMMNVPAYSMNTAYPTYKLMLIEEDNSGPFFVFDNFYSYASVMDIEVIKYHDKPDEAIIQITNLSHSLQHRLYDDTAAGKLEATEDRFNIDPAGGLVLGGPNAASGEIGTGGGVSTSGIIAGKTAAGRPYQKKNLTEGRGETYSRIPLKFFALQTGSKIQVRMGYSNNPDNLWPVFTGQVTEIEGEEILTLKCQSFQLELMTVPGTTVIANSRFGFNFLTGAAMGGWSLSNAGDTGSVIAKMLGAEAARHFGRWQIGVQRDPLLKGFSWVDLAGQALASTSNQTLAQVGALLQTGYDRSAENILINSTINFDASKSKDDPTNAGRRLFDENTDWLQSYLRIGSASYSIPKQSELSIWDIIKDVSRRYPHYNLLVKDYGFPYGADATLVYAHPLDWYYSRPPLYGEAEQEKPNNKTQGQAFQTWWATVGSAKWNAAWEHAFDSNSVFGVPIRQALGGAQKNLTAMAGSGPEGFTSAIQQIHDILTGTTVNPPANSALDSFFNALQDVQNLFAHAANVGNLTQGFYKNLDNSFQELLREWQVQLVLMQPAANSSRIKPVRKYHLIDYNHIVHNGMVVNDRMYNAVKILDEAPFKFNQNIPGQHTRVLNVTEMINDPNQNCSSMEMKRVYAQSFLREEVGKMYRGEIILRGVPEIEPLDVILLNDPSTGIVGPVEVETVIHSFNLENGFITIIKPRLMVITNESVSMNIIRTLGFAWANASAELHSLGATFLPSGPFSTISGTIAGAGLVAGVVAASALAFALPVGITLASLALLSGYGILKYLENWNDQNFFKLQPLSRFGRPWIGGLQGFAISDFGYSIFKDFQRFDAEEISPTIESWNEFLNYRADYVNGE